MAKEDLKKWDGAVILPVDKLVITNWNTNILPVEEFAALCKEIKDGDFDAWFLR